MTSTSATLPEPTSAAGRIVEIDLLALDLASCTRCVGTLANIDAAIRAVGRVLELTGTTVRLRKVVIGSEEEARRHRFVSSPTIRIGGLDIVFETLESTCDSCSDLCGCAEGTSCRVWRYQGAEHTEAPVGLIAEALLREIVGGRPQRSAEGAAAAYEVPANLRGFFAGKAPRSASVASPCCAPSEQASCCEPAEKATCCESSQPAACGCK